MGRARCLDTLEPAIHLSSVRVGLWSSCPWPGERTMADAVPRLSTLALQGQWIRQTSVSEQSSPRLRSPKATPAVERSAHTRREPARASTRFTTSKFWHLSETDLRTPAAAQPSYGGDVLAGGDDRSNYTSATISVRSTPDSMGSLPGSVLRRSETEIPLPSWVAARSAHVGGRVLTAKAPRPLPFSCRLSAARPCFEPSSLLLCRRMRGRASSSSDRGQHSKGAHCDATCAASARPAGDLGPNIPHQRRAVLTVQLTRLLCPQARASDGR